MFKLFRDFEKDEQVVIFGDPAEGGDPCAAQSLSKKHLDLPMVFHQKMESAQFGYELFRMAIYIEKHTGRKPWIGVERNVGAATIHVLLTLNYPRLWRMPTVERDGEEGEGKIGWVMTEATRTRLLDDLALVLRQGGITIYDEETLRECKTFRRNNLGKAEAAPNCHDDLVITLGGAWQMHQLIKSDSSPEDVKRLQQQLPKENLFDKKGFYRG